MAHILTTLSNLKCVTLLEIESYTTSKMLVLLFITNFILITKQKFDIIILGTFNKLGGAELLTKGGCMMNEKDFFIFALVIIIFLLLLLLFIVLI